MSTQSEVSAVDQLVLARLLVGGEKGATFSQIQKDLTPLLEHRWAGGALTERLDQTLDRLEAAGLVSRVRKGKTNRGTLTTEGRRESLQSLGLGQLPPKTTWSQLKKKYLPARALGLHTPRAEEAKRLGTDNGFKGALIKSQYDLKY